MSHVASLAPDPALEERTAAGIIDELGVRLRIFRQSSTDHDNLSCEVYTRAGDAWVRQREERVKYIPRDEMPGTCTEVDGVSVWSLEESHAAQVEALRVLLRPRKELPEGR